MSVAGNIEVINPLVRRVFTNTAENDMAIFVDSPGQSIHLGCNSNATVPSTVMITQSNLVLNGDIMFPNRVIAMSRLRVTQPENLMIPANISTSYSSVPGVNPSNGSNFDLSLGVSVSNFRFLQTSTGNICASLGFDGSLRINSLLTSNIIRLNSNGALSNITGLTMSNGQILGSLNDSAGSPGFAWNGDTGTGIFHLGTGQVGVSVGSTQVASFSNGGVSVTGTVDATTLRQGGTGVILTTGGTITGTLNAQTLQQANISVLTTNGGTVNGTLNAQTLQQAGNAISTLFAPSNHIHDVTTSSITGILPVGKGGTGVSTLTANKLLLGNGTNVVSAVDSLHWTGSYLGINTPSPSSTLHVNGDMTVTGAINGMVQPSTLTYQGNLILNPFMQNPLTYTSETFNLGIEGASLLKNIWTGPRMYGHSITRVRDDTDARYRYYIRITRGAVVLANTGDWSYSVSFVLPSYHVNYLNWGTTTPINASLSFSFWARSSVAGIHWVVLTNFSIPVGATFTNYQTFNLPAANTWYFCQVTFSNYNGPQLFAQLSLAFHYTGLVYTTTNTMANGSITAANSWYANPSQAKVNHPSTVTSMANFYSSSTNTFDIAAPCLVPGSASISYPNYYAQTVCSMDLNMQ